MGLAAATWLDLDLPQANKRLLTIVEMDGCFADGVAVATNCWVGRRTMRVEDYGKAVAVFVDTQNGQALRLAPRATLRWLAPTFAPDAHDNWEAMLLGYQRMQPEAMFVAHAVELVTPIEEIISQPGLRVQCENCGEEIINGREVAQINQTLCRACAGAAYYRAASYTDAPSHKSGHDESLPLEQLAEITMMQACPAVPNGDISKR